MLQNTMEPDPEVTIMYAVKKGILNLIPRHSLKIHLSTQYNRKTLPTPYQEDVENVWADKTAANPRMWNGTKFRLDSIDEKEETVTFNLGVTCYKDFIGTNWSPNAPLYHSLGKEHHQNTQVYMSDALGVGAFVETADHCVVLLRRSQHCGEAVGLWDIPGGHPEPEEIVGKIAMGEIVVDSMSEIAVREEIFNSTKREVIEEVNIPDDRLTDPVLLGVARNTTSAGRPSSEYYIKCSLTSEEIKERYSKGTHAEAEESTNIKFIPMDKIMNIHKDSTMWNDMAPSAKGCVQLYQLAKLNSL